MARTYFNCPTLVGVELENQGGTGTMISHWEKRLLGVRVMVPRPLAALLILHQNELMTGVLTFNPLFSVLTLAALQDSGLAIIIEHSPPLSIHPSLLPQTGGTRSTTVWHSPWCGGTVLAVSLQQAVVEVT